MDEQIDSRQYLTFHLSDEQYGLNVLQVREVLEIPRITRVPRMPPFMKGVINIRGSVIPVLDLRSKLGMEEAERTVHSRVIIIEVQAQEETINLGILVDSVQEVLEIPKNDISPAPQIGTKIDAYFIQGIAKIDQDFVIVIDLDKIFENNEIASLQAEGLESDALSESPAS